MLPSVPRCCALRNDGAVTEPDLTPFTAAQLDELEGRLLAWFASSQAENPAVASVERDADHQRRWYMRVAGEEKEWFSILWTLGQRTLHYDSYFLPAPEENQADFYAHLLTRNRTMFGGAFNIGDEGAIYLAGQLGVESVTDDELDRILGSFYQWTEQFFRPALRIGFASRL